MNEKPDTVLTHYPIGSKKTHIAPPQFAVEVIIVGFVHSIFDVIIAIKILTT